MKYFYISLGAILGASARYLVQMAFKQFSDTIYGTLLVNLVGCFIIGVASSFPLSDTTRLGLITGFLGALTTMSSFSLEMYQLWTQQKLGLLVGMVLVTVLGGIIFCALGAQLATKVASSRAML